MYVVGPFDLIEISKNNLRSMFGISDYIAIITINRLIPNTCGGAFTISMNI